MATTTAIPTTETTLYMKRTFKAPREQVFDAWTNPEKFKQWFAAGNDYVGLPGEVDLRIGGRFRIGMRHIPTGNDHYATGVYREIRFPDRLVFTWIWEGKPDHGESRITIEFHDMNGETEMRFTHDFFPSKLIRDDHEGGWNECFERLEKLLQS